MLRDEKPNILFALAQTEGSVSRADQPSESHFQDMGGWHWLEQRLMYREMMRRERQKHEEGCAQLDFLSALRIAA